MRGDDNGAPRDMEGVWGGHQDEISAVGPAEIPARLWIRAGADVEHGDIHGYERGV